VVVLNSTDGGKIAAASDEMVFWYFSVCFEHLYPLFAIGEISLLQSTTENLKNAKLYPASSPLAQECQRLVAKAPPQGNVDHRLQVLRVAATVLSAEFKNTRSQRSGFVRIEDHMMQVFEALSSTELLTLSVGDLARKFSCSRRHLNRLFHQHFGCSVAALRMEIRLLKASSLLRDQDVKIIHVAEQCGFNHLGLFNACFKKRFGSTPGQWRKGIPTAEEPAPDVDVGHPSCPMHVNGLCPWTPKPDERTDMARKITSMHETSRSNAPAKPGLREGVIRNLPKVSDPMNYKSSFGLNMQNQP
jgi:AraC-like DNA-binding protein